MYADLRYKEQYLMEINDKTLQMVQDSRIKAACTRSSCVFSVSHSILTRRIGHKNSMRFCILELRGPTEADVGRCNKTLEAYFPDYKRRKPHDSSNMSVRLKFSEWTPDNTSLYYMCQRFGQASRTVGDLELSPPCGGLITDLPKYPSSLAEMIRDKPRSKWIITQREMDGKYTTSFGNCKEFCGIIFRGADKNTSRVGVFRPPTVTKPLPRMNYFQDPYYIDRIIDPMLERIRQQREEILEAERHSGKTMKPKL